MNSNINCADMKVRCSARLSQTIDADNTYKKQIPSITNKDISIVIPVKDNQKGIDIFLRGFIDSHECIYWPKEIIIVDNNSVVPIVISDDILQTGLNVQLLSCIKRGPAAARNMGVRHATGLWILFADSDCIPTSTTILGYINSDKRAIALVGDVRATMASVITRFYDEQKVLIPHFKANASGEKVPLYIVTANALVLREALIECGLFNENYRYAAGEDVDLGVRLWSIGNIEYEFQSTILHEYESGIFSFCRRFIRYGKGNWQLEQTHGINMRAKHSPPSRKIILNYFLRRLQCVCLNLGYTVECYCQLKMELTPQKISEDAIPNLE